MFLIEEISKTIENGIREAMDILKIDRMPTSLELRSIGMTSLGSLIGKYGGFIEWANKLDLNTKKKFFGIKEKDIPELIEGIKKEININRMPSRSEIVNVTGNNALHNNIVRSGGYRYWAKKLNLELKESETKTGQDYEEVAISLLTEKGFHVERMSTKHPFDLLVNESVKVDVKSGKAHLHIHGYRCHTFITNKKNGSCDIYLMIAIDENEEIENVFVIPSHHLKLTTLNVVKNSMYNKYIGKFDLINKYSDFYNSVNVN